MKTAAILAGGRGSRLRSLTGGIPKAMVPIDGRPIMEFVVGALRASGVQRILAILQFQPALIVDYFRDGAPFGVAMDYLLQEGDLDTAGSVRQALDLLEDDDFLVASSDILFHGDLLPGVEFHRARGSVATLALARVEDRSEFGAVIRGPDQRILQFLEKPRPGAAGGGMVSAGIYFLSRGALEWVTPGKPVDFGRDLFPALVREGAPIYGWDLPGYWRDVGTPPALESARREARELVGLKGMVTRWPAVRCGNGGRIWIRLNGPTGEWLVMNATTIGDAAGLVWKHLSENREMGVPLSQIEKLKGVGPKEALAAVGWLAREGKIPFDEEGRATRIRLSPSESTAR